MNIGYYTYRNPFVNEVIRLEKKNDYPLLLRLFCYLNKVKIRFFKTIFMRLNDFHDLIYTLFYKQNNLSRAHEYNHLSQTSLPYFQTNKNLQNTSL